jgi:hypothetical protein
MISISGCGSFVVLFQCSYAAFFMISISGWGSFVVFVSVFLRGILNDFHLWLWFIRGFCFSVPTRHSLWFPSQVVVRSWFFFQCSYAAFFMISILGCGLIWFLFQCPFAAFFMISISDCGSSVVFVSVFLRGIFMISIPGCGFCFSVPTRHSLWFLSQVVVYSWFLFQCSYVAFFMVSISGCGLFVVLFQCSYAAFFMISISGCGSSVVFVSVFLHGILYDFHLRM